jgi:hypothetical protein
MLKQQSKVELRGKLGAKGFIAGSFPGHEMHFEQLFARKLSIGRQA